MADSTVVTETWTGGCVCAQVRYAWRPSIKFKSYACHCIDCQTRSGSSFTLQQTVLFNDLEVAGALAEGGSIQPSGARARLFACPQCQCRIYGTNDARPGFAIVRAGTFDHSNQITPDFHVWTQSKQPWVVIPSGVVALATQPDDTQGWTRLLMPDAT
jgi:hypothetical protein